MKQSHGNYEEIMELLKSKSNSKNKQGMARFGINPKNAWGVSVTDIRAIANTIKKNHNLALKLWNSGIREARILASILDEPEKVTPPQMEEWISGFDSWDVCDQVCLNLFSKVENAHEKAIKWSEREKEFEKRAGFALMAVLAWHGKGNESAIQDFLPIIKREANDERNYVKKAVNWALRQIGKHNRRLNADAIKTAMELEKMDSKSAKWIAFDALRELEGEKVQNRLKR